MVHGCSVKQSDVMEKKKKKQEIVYGSTYLFSIFNFNFYLVRI